MKKETRLKVLSGGTPPPFNTCYTFSFTEDSSETIDRITFQDFGNISVSISLSLTAAGIKTAIETALNGDLIMYDSVTVYKIQDGSPFNIYDYSIIIKNPSDIPTQVLLSSTATAAPTTNNCVNTNCYVLNFTIDLLNPPNLIDDLEWGDAGGGIAAPINLIGNEVTDRASILSAITTGTGITVDDVIVVINSGAFSTLDYVVTIQHPNINFTLYSVNGTPAVPVHTSC